MVQGNIWPLQTVVPCESRRYACQLAIRAHDLRHITTAFHQGRINGSDKRRSQSLPLFVCVFTGRSTSQSFSFSRESFVTEEELSFKGPSVIVEGDIIANDFLQELIRGGRFPPSSDVRSDHVIQDEKQSRQRRGTIAWNKLVDRRWPHGVVYYSFHVDFLKGRSPSQPSCAQHVLYSLICLTHPHAPSAGHPHFLFWLFPLRYSLIMQLCIERIKLPLVYAMV